MSTEIAENLSSQCRENFSTHPITKTPFAAATTPFLPIMSLPTPAPRPPTNAPTVVALVMTSFCVVVRKSGERSVPMLTSVPEMLCRGKGERGMRIRMVGRTWLCRFLAMGWVSMLYSILRRLTGTKASRPNVVSIRPTCIPFPSSNRARERRVLLPTALASGYRTTPITLFRHHRPSSRSSSRS